MHGYACILASPCCFDKKFMTHFQPIFTFPSLNSNTKMQCEQCSRLIKKTLARQESVVVVHLLGIGNILMLITSDIHNVANHAIAKNSC